MTSRDATESGTGLTLAQETAMQVALNGHVSETMGYRLHVCVGGPGSCATDILKRYYAALATPPAPTPAREDGLTPATFQERKAEIVRTIMRSGITKSERQAGDLAEDALLTALTGERWDVDDDHLQPGQWAFHARLAATTERPAEAEEYR